PQCIGPHHRLAPTLGEPSLFRRRDERLLTDLPIPSGDFFQQKCVEASIGEAPLLVVAQRLFVLRPSPAPGAQPQRRLHAKSVPSSPRSCSSLASRMPRCAALASSQPTTSVHFGSSALYV